MSKLPHHPDNEVFKMTLNFDDPENQPIRMIRRSEGHAAPEQYTFVGRNMTGVQTGRFMWVASGKQPNLAAVRVAIAPYGSIPDGRWLKAVAATFEPDFRDTLRRGIADPSWLLHGQHACFPMQHCYGLLTVRLADLDVEGYTRWLIQVSE